MNYNISGKMLKGLLGAFLVMSFYSFTYASEIALRDSIGIEKKDGHTFILHKVEPKETIYGLSKRYKVTTADIIEHNPEAGSSLKIGEVLRIPYEDSTNKNSRKITHVVAPSQTLYSISKIYNADLEDIKKWNNMSGNDLNVGQELVIHTKKNKDTPDMEESNLSGTEASVTADTIEKKPSGKIVHKVETSQTLFSISQMYDVLVEDIKKWNNLSSNELDVGQQLTIRIKSEPYPYDKGNGEAPSGENENTEALANIEPATGPGEKKGQKEVKQEGKEETAEDEVEKEIVQTAKNPNSSGFKKIVELGMAEVIEDASDTKKYIALHRTAPIGTIMQVTNEMNDQNVFVRVIGKLPNTGVNDKVLIKLSKPAFERLGAVNHRFPAEISYVP